eukprot:TRINITY_DN4857_c0_g1_i1.p1 TRINITY_DN4857_c0_g1~~TRINITY_DN4857_c0_g1_i1.p1  ORF type:complete len:297 (+),score=128.62 TRINITY_DN4857_c0_g1_i1:82-891(+)
MLQICKTTPGNDACMDCGERTPKWAVVNWGIVVCIRCSGHHRNMGVHISKVKSVNLDKWQPDEVRWMKRMGNAKAKEALEAKRKKSDPRPTPSTPDAELSDFLKKKYAELKYRGEKKPPSFKSWLKREEKRRKEAKEGKPKKEKKAKKEKKQQSEDSDSGCADSSDERATPVSPPKVKAKKVASRETPDILSFFDEGPSQNGRAASPPAETANATNGRKSKSPAPASPVTPAALSDASAASNKRGAFGNVTGDPTTVDTRKDALLSLFS